MSKPIQASLVGWLGLSLILLGLNYVPLFGLWSLYGILTLLVWPLAMVIVQILAKEKPHSAQSDNVRHLAG